MSCDPLVANERYMQVKLCESQSSDLYLCALVANCVSVELSKHGFVNSPNCCYVSSLISCSQMTLSFLGMVLPVTPPGIDPGTVRLVAQRLNHYATPGPCKCLNDDKIELKKKRHSVFCATTRWHVMW